MVHRPLSGAPPHPSAPRESDTRLTRRDIMAIAAMHALVSRGALMSVDDLCTRSYEYADGLEKVRQP